MSSRSQTKSLDRDIQSYSKQKKSYLNIQQVNNSSEHLACNLHNKIEAIFEHHPVERFESELIEDKISNDLASIFTKTNIDGVILSKLIQSIKTQFLEQISNDPYQLLLNYLDFVSNCQNLFQGISKKLFQTILNGLLRYCVSLAKYCNSDIDFVINYEKIIQKNEGDIIKEVKDIDNLDKKFMKIVGSSKLVLQNVLEVVSIIRQIRASINKLYYLVTEWVDEERNYPGNLNEHIKDVKSELFSLEQKTVKNDYSIKQRQMKIVSIEKHLKLLDKNHLTLRRKLHRVRLSQSQIETKSEEIELQTSSRVDELKSMKNKIKSLEYCKQKSEKTVRIPYHRISMEIHATKTEQRELEAKTVRLEDNKLAFIRHKDRLRKIVEQLREKITNVKDQISYNQMVLVKLKENFDDDVNSQKTDIEKLKILQVKLKDLNFISSKKSSPDTLRQLRNHGRLTNDCKDLSLTEKMCDLVSQKTVDWKELYIHLPMFPERSTEQRYHDIDIIDFISARNDGTPKKQTKMCLNKWRLFYHNATPEHLIEALLKSKNREIAEELQMETNRSKHRFEEEETLYEIKQTDQTVQASA